MGELEYLANVERDCDLWDVDQMLRENLEVRRNHKDNPQKAIIIYLAGDGNYPDIFWGRAKMTCLEAIAVCEAVKNRMLKMIGGD